MRLFDRSGGVWYHLEMKRILLTSFAAVGAAVSVFANGSNAVRSTLERYVNGGRIAGVVSVTGDSGGETFDCVGWADMENKVPMAPDTMFAIFSMTKTFTGAAIMCAIDEGKMSLDDAVSKYLPEFADVRMEDGSRPQRELTPIAIKKADHFVMPLSAHFSKHVAVFKRGRFHFFVF